MKQRSLDKYNFWKLIGEIDVGRREIECKSNPEMQATSIISQSTGYCLSFEGRLTAALNVMNTNHD